jgi:hypothetical protein
MRLLPVIAVGILACWVQADAGRNLSLKAAVHVVPHQERSCETGVPEIEDCVEISETLSGCAAFDAFPVFYDVVEVKRVDYALTWPAEWGSCSFTPCAGDYVEGDISLPGDSMTHTWNQCVETWSVVTGYATFGPPSVSGYIGMAAHAEAGFLGTTDCSGVRDLPIGRAFAGVCGVPGEDPCDCGCPTGGVSWSAVKAFFR